jgi:hypothetical protein
MRQPMRKVARALAGQSAPVEAEATLTPLRAAAG